MKETIVVEEREKNWINMKPKLATRRSVQTAPCLEIPAQHDVAKETNRPSRGSRILFFDENGNETKESCKSEKPTCEITIATPKNARPQSESVLFTKNLRRASSVEAEKFAAYCAARRGSRTRRNHFLRSFGQTEELYPNLSEKELLLEEARGMVDNVNTLQLPVDYVEPTEITLDSNRFLKLRTKSAGPVLMRSSASTEVVHENLLKLRGTEFTSDLPGLDLTARIRIQSAKRRIRRIMEAEKEKAEREQIEQEKRQQELAKKKRFTLRGTTLAVIAMNVSAAGFNFNSFTEKKRWLAEKRAWTRQIAVAKFGWAVRVVIVLGRVLRALVSYSAEMIPETAAQRSFRTLRDNSEVKEILFNKSLYQRGKSQYAYVPGWAKKIMAKPPMERRDSELSQLHSMLKGLASYDKFTYRIQFAMCRAMTYIKVEHSRVILRKGHIGVSFYFIFSGSVFVNVEELLKKTGHVMWHTAVTLQRGDSFGELALLRNITRTATVVVREDAELLVVERNVFSRTCPKIYDKELADKIQLCKSLSIFGLWTDDALKNLCLEAQIQEWKINKIIVKDSSKEMEWIYLCMQGKCSIIQALDLRVGPRSPRPRRMTHDDIYFAMGLTKKKNRSQSDPSKIWRKELEEGLKTPFKFNEKDGDNEKYSSDIVVFLSESEDEEDNRTGAEKILDAMDLPYKDEPHTMGDGSYVINEDEEDDEDDEGESAEVGPSELEKRNKTKSENFSELIKTESRTGKLNREVMYLNIATMMAGDIFDISDVLRPTGRKLMLVSKGAVMLRIKRADFFRYSTKQTLRHARKVIQEMDYPSEEVIYRSYNERCSWEQFKNKELKTTVERIQEKCIRHNKSFKDNMPEPEKPLTPARMGDERPAHEKFDEFLSFVYNSHKMPDSDRLEGGFDSSPFVTKIGSSCFRNNSTIRDSNSPRPSTHQTTIENVRQKSARRVTFSFVENSS